MKSEIVKFMNKPFVRNVIIMSTGTAAAQFISMILSPIITRLYGPEAFGLMGTFMSIVGIVAPISALTYPIAIVLPKKANHAKGLIKLSILICSGIALLVTIILLFFSKDIAILFRLNTLASFLYLIPFVIFFAGIFQVVEQWFIRTKQFMVTAKVAFFQSLLLQGGKVLIGVFYPFATVLIVLSAMNQGVRAILMLIFGNRFKEINNYSHSDDEHISLFKLAKKYKDFPLYRAPQTFIDTFSESIPVLLLSSFFGPATVGFYSIGRTVLNLPTQLIAKSVGDVFYPKVSNAAINKEDITSIIKKATITLGFIGIVPFGFVILFGPWLFSFVYGANWTTAGEFARWIALWSFASFILQPSVRSLPVLSAQALHLRFTVISLVFRTIAIVIGNYLFNSALMAIAFFGISSSILNLILILTTVNLSKKIKYN